MRFGIVGLGRMGSGLAGKALEQGHQPVGWDPSHDARQQAEEQGIEAVSSLAELVDALGVPRFLIMYVPHGPPVDDNLHTLRPLLDEGDIVADGGNSHWADSKRRHDALAEDGIRYLDIGTSGGIGVAPGWAGAAFMAGGDRQAFDHVAPVLRSMAVDDGAVHHVGGSSSGHFVKLVHNAIEFGMLQAIGEGVELLVRSDHDLDLAGLFEHWSHGTVIRSWLVELMGNALREGGIGPEDDVPVGFDPLSTYVEDTGEVKWVLDWAMDRDVPTPVVATAQQMLMAYRDLDSPAAKAVALMRNQFGGHPLHRPPNE